MKNKLVMKISKKTDMKFDKIIAFFCLLCSVWLVEWNKISSMWIYKRFLLFFCHFCEIPPKTKKEDSFFTKATPKET
jgi:RNase P subunit RPR2